MESLNFRNGMEFKLQCVNKYIEPLNNDTNVRFIEFESFDFSCF